MESVVVKELASKHQRNGDHAPDLILGADLKLSPFVLHGIKTLCKVVHAEQDGGARKPCRGQNLRHELTKGRVDLRVVRHHEPG